MVGGRYMMKMERRGKMMKTGMKRGWRMRELMRVSMGWGRQEEEEVSGRNGGLVKLGWEGWREWIRARVQGGTGVEEELGEEVGRLGS